MSDSVTDTSDTSDSDTEDIQRESQPDAQCSAHTKQKMAFGPPARSCHLTKWPEFQGYGFTILPNKALGERQETLEIVVELRSYGVLCMSIVPFFQKCTPEQTIPT